MLQNGSAPQNQKPNDYNKRTNGRVPRNTFSFQTPELQTTAQDGHRVGGQACPGRGPLGCAAVETDGVIH